MTSTYNNHKNWKHKHRKQEMHKNREQETHEMQENMKKVVRDYTWCQLKKKDKISIKL